MARIISVTGIISKVGSYGVLFVTETFNIESMRSYLKIDLNRFLGCKNQIFNAWHFVVVAVAVIK